MCINIYIYVYFYFFLRIKEMRAEEENIAKGREKVL